MSRPFTSVSPRLLPPFKVSSGSQLSSPTTTQLRLLANQEAIISLSRLSPSFYHSPAPVRSRSSFARTPLPSWATSLSLRRRLSVFLYLSFLSAERAQASSLNESPVRHSITICAQSEPLQVRREHLCRFISPPPCRHTPCSPPRRTSAESLSERSCHPGSSIQVRICELSMPNRLVFPVSLAIWNIYPLEHRNLLPDHAMAFFLCRTRRPQCAHYHVLYPPAHHMLVPLVRSESAHGLD